MLLLIQSGPTITLPNWAEGLLVMGLLLSGASNLFQFLVYRRDVTHKRDLDTIASLERSATATKGELETTAALHERVKRQLDSITEEYETLVGLDMQHVLELAREGLHVEIARMKKVIEKQALLIEGEGKK
jgi:N-methylhydantoinase B/oxoprolinase/acetone carboxylase alpha subunit